MKRLFRFTRADGRGLLVVTAVLCAVVGIIMCRGNREKEGEVSALSAEEREEIARFEEACRADSVKRVQRYKQRKKENPADRHKDRVGENGVECVWIEGKGWVDTELFVFDPNSVDSLTLRTLGLRTWQVHNLLQYRRKGGRWKSAEDFSRLYGLSDEEFRRLRPYIRISALSSGRERGEDVAWNKGSRDTLPFRRVEKYPEGTVLELNTADTTMLKGIPGVGSYCAGKICRYRERLGGFVSVEQLNEIQGFPAGIERWFKVETAYHPRRIPLNTADFQTLVRHPYLDYEQVKSIVNYRKKYGKLKSWNDLRLTGLFPDNAVSRLTPYFSFE